MEIKARFDHYNINVFDLKKSIKFYEDALGFKEVRRKEASDGSFILVYMGDNVTGFTLELTWLRDWDRVCFPSIHRKWRETGIFFRNYWFMSFKLIDIFNQFLSNRYFSFWFFA
jgi:catechol 2,3-dioxygenase-like lactoylglutathione lyase family enzyme